MDGLAPSHVAPEDLPEDEEVPPLRRRPLFAAAQALKPDVKPTPEADHPTPADNADAPGQDEPEPNDATPMNEADTAVSSPEPELETASDADAETSETVATETVSEQTVPVTPAIEFAGDPDNADDLTRIRGIGKSTAKSLNAMGIWQFDQIAELGPEGLETLRGKLSAQMGRSLDKWPDQARELSSSSDD